MLRTMLEIFFAGIAVILAIISVLGFLYKEKGRGQCPYCDYEYLSMSEHPCNMCHHGDHWSSKK